MKISVWISWKNPIRKLWVSPIHNFFGLTLSITVAGPPEYMGTWGLVPTIFWDLVCHFQICKLEICTINGSKVTEGSPSPPCSKPFRRPWVVPALIWRVNSFCMFAYKRTYLWMYTSQILQRWQKLFNIGCKIFIFASILVNLWPILRILFPLKAYENCNWDSTPILQTNAT